MENSEVRFLSNNYINFHSVFTSQVSTDGEIKYSDFYIKVPFSSFIFSGLLNQGHSFSKFLIGGNGHYNDLYLKIWGSSENSTNILCLAITTGIIMHYVDFKTGLKSLPSCISGR